MTIVVFVEKHCCPPHHWLVSQSPSEGVALARCMRQGCAARQFQVIWISKEAVEEANRLNKQLHYTRVKLDKKAMSSLMRYLNQPARRYDRDSFMFI